ncbi:MAG TPA: bifunctional precorrin-2 dehydrogenase/sirohydrochlorin ferrochelatase [Gemmatimonadaceae bacterium]|nr:bifunctional precorrin-2 dehydrogenase/sirohydrochlorin ferrochelatase [Gemmatimonadaceae bacterium]
MSAYPVMLEGSAISALVVGGGRVASRKATALVEAGADVRVLSPRVEPALEELASGSAALRITKAAYAPDQIGDALLIVAATDDASLNAQIAADARARGRLVNVVDTPELGNCITPAVHRAGDLVVAVSAGGVPGAAVRIRDSMARLLDARYSDAVRELAALRRALLDAGRRDRWHEAANSLVAPDFCEQVESGRFAARIAEWR